MNRLKKRRIDLEFTQYEIEKLSGISQSRLSLAERGFRYFTPDEIKKLARILRIDEKELFNNED